VGTRGWKIKVDVIIHTHSPGVPPGTMLNECRFTERKLVFIGTYSKRRKHTMRNLSFPSRHAFGSVVGSTTGGGERERERLRQGLKLRNYEGVSLMCTHARLSGISELRERFEFS